MYQEIKGDGFDIIPSNRDLMAAEIQLLELDDRELVLKKHSRILQNYMISSH